MCEGKLSRNTRHTILRRDSTLCRAYLLSLPSSGVTFAAVPLLPPNASLFSCRLQTVFVYFIFIFCC